MNKPTCFIELCAGTAALSIRLQGGKGAKPPVSRMGAKTGYADVILSVLGLYPGLGAESYVWCEPDDGVRGLLVAYCQPSVLKEAAAILRGWKDEEPRALWERLRAEGKYQGGTARELARWARIVSANELIPIDCESWSNTGKGGTTISINPDHEFYRPMERLCRGLQSLPPFPPVTIAADARDITPPKLPEGVICYMDPPYLNTTGYKHDLPRSEVVRMAHLWADAGATVCISEAEPIPELVADGWHAVKIGTTRQGSKRKLSKQQAEWLTLSDSPSFVPRQTLDLFGNTNND